MKSNFTINFLLWALFLVGSVSLSGQNVPVTVTYADSSQVTFTANQGSFGLDASSCTFEAFVSTPEFATNDDNETTACNGVTNDFTDKIAFIDRGTCQFGTKALVGQNAGAIAVVICNNDPGAGAVGMAGGDDGDAVTIYAAMLSYEDCQIILSSIENITHVQYGGSIEPVVDPDPGVAIWNEDFSDSLDGWEIIGIESDVSGITAEQALWTYSPEGKTSETNFPSTLQSESKCNGAALFDFALLEGDNGAGGTITGDLISPTIDLSDYGPVVLKFVNWNLPLNGENSVSYSVDNGANWSAPIIMTTENVFSSAERNIVGSEYVKIPLPSLAGAAEAKIKFTASGDFYYWMIDDLKLEELTGKDLRIQVGYPLFSYAVPSAASLTMDLGFDVGNNGAEDISDASVSISVVNIDNGLEYYADSFTIDSTISIGSSKGIELPLKTFAAHELDLGTYKITYNIDFPSGDDKDYSNNVQEMYFEVTVEYFGKEDGANTFYTVPAGEPEYTVLTGYFVPVSGLSAKSALWQVGTPDNIDQLSDDSYVHLYLLKLKDGLNFSDIDVSALDLFDHPSLDYITDNYISLGGIETGDDIHGFFDVDEVAIELEEGAFYFIAAEYDSEGPGGIIGFPNSRIAHSFSGNGPDYGFLFSTSLMVAGDQWYNSGFGTDTPAMLRLETTIDVVGVDDEPLAEGAFSVYPNPTTEAVYADLNFEKSTDVDIVVADITGKVLMIRKLAGVTAKKEKVNVSGFANGTYLMRVSTDEGTTTQKFVIQK